MTFNINDIISHINKNYFAKPNYYTVSILGGNIQKDAPVDVTFNCSNINIPGINLGFATDKRFGVGTFKNYPNGKAFTEITASFYESEFEAERKYFVEWMNKIFDPKTGKLEFYDQYTKTIIITQYNRKGQVVYEAKMLEAWPSNVSAMDRGYNLGDAPGLLNVAIQFFQLEEKFFTNGAVKSDSSVGQPIQIQPVSKKPTK